jgi:hypothetical protein
MGGGWLGSMYGPRLIGGRLDQRAQAAAEEAQSERDRQLLMAGMRMSGGQRVLDTAQYGLTGQDPLMLELQALAS